VAAFAVLTPASEAEVKSRLVRDALARGVAWDVCGDGASCTAVRAVVLDPHAMTLETRRVADWGMPSGEALETMTASLTAAEKQTLPSLSRVILVTARSPVTRDALAARAGFAATSVLATTLRGLVYDETLHRIEDPRTFAGHAITVPLGASAWRLDRVNVVLYEQDDGTARLLTLGMRRFGAPDVEVEGASMNASHAMGTLVDRVAEQLAAGATRAPVALADGGEAPIGDLVEAPHHEGDPDNIVLRLVPVGAHDPRAYDALVARVFGRIDGVVDAPDSAELVAVAERARAALPGVLDAYARERSSGATLLVKLPFRATSPDGATTDGAALEWMWVAVTGVDDAGIAGTLANTPVYAADLRSGSPVEGRLADVADYVFERADGGKQGGESIRVLGGGR
jgi:uncharacterized protein YegJ (DUF2314 family)